jgi:hypothetical protein
MNKGTIHPPCQARAFSASAAVILAQNGETGLYFVLNSVFLVKKRLMNGWT